MYCNLINFAIWHTEPLFNVTTHHKEAPTNQKISRCLLSHINQHVGPPFCGRPCSAKNAEH